MLRGRLRNLPLLGALALAFGPAPGHAATPEAQVKAAYLHRLASFVRWPDGGGGINAFRFCVAGRNDIADVLQELVRGQNVLGQPIRVERLTAAQGDSAKNCQVLFLGRGPQTTRSLLAATAGLPVLTVSDRNNGTWGGVVEFLIRDGKVRFAIDRDSAARRQLDLSSKLMDGAVEVER